MGDGIQKISEWVSWNMIYVPLFVIGMIMIIAEQLASRPINMEHISILSFAAILIGISYLGFDLRELLKRGDSK
jgi:hypothetical protein